MDSRFVFKRCELKYLMDERQAAAVRDALNEHMKPDRYAHSTIRNIYFDTPDYLLARRSISKPMYKEKLRLRSYGAVSADDEVFVELKKKYDSVVYKRRLTMPLRDVIEWMQGCGEGPSTQIGEEIGYMKVRYPEMRPAMYLSYERDAYRADRDLRVTIDSNILARTDDVDMTLPTGGHQVLPEGYTLMEIKTLYGFPQWLTQLLSSTRLYNTGFSKYGNASKEIVLKKVPEEFIRLSTVISAVPEESA